MIDGKPRLVSIQPGDLLAEQGVAPGEDRGGIVFANNSCPSQGTMDVFVEPILPRPTLLILGASPIAVALADLVMRCLRLVPEERPAADEVHDALARLSPAHRTVLVETFYHGGTLATVASQLGIPHGTARSRLHYALHALRQQLQNQHAAA